MSSRFELAETNDRKEIIRLLRIVAGEQRPDAIRLIKSLPTDQQRAIARARTESASLREVVELEAAKNGLSTDEYVSKCMSKLWRKEHGTKPAGKSLNFAMPKGDKNDGQ